VLRLKASIRMDPLTDWALAMEMGAAGSEDLEAAMSRFPRFRKAISYGAKAGALKNAYRDARSSLSAARKRGKQAMGFGSRIKRDFRKGLADFGRAERKAGLRRDSTKQRQAKARRAAQAAARSRPSSRRGLGFKALYGVRGIKPRRGTPTSKLVGKFRKAKKIRTAASKFAKRHFDDYGSLERDHCAYIGFQRHGCKDRMWSIIGEAVTKAVLAKMKVYPRAYDEQVGLTNFDKLQFMYKRVSVPGGAEHELFEEISFSSTTTFEELSALIAVSLESKAERTADADSEYAYYLAQVVAFNSGGSDYNRIMIKDVGESVIELYATQVITIKNLTPNDGGTSDLDVVGVNPISGKKYEFNNFRPKLIDEIERNNSDLGAFYAVDDTNGINTAVALPGVANADHIVAHPPVPRQLFTNCARATPVFMGAGGVKTERTTFKIKHKLSTLTERIYYNQFDKGSFGGCTFFAFERKTRSVTGESRVKISFDRALHMSAHCKLAVKKTMLKHYDNNAIGAIADA